MTSSTTNSRFTPYKQALAAISQRTRTPLPSLLVSFAIVHELTAIVPIAGFFFGARALGVGESIVGALAPRSGVEPADEGLAAQVRDSWVGERLREWMVEGEAQAERVGRRYGWFGFEKGTKPPVLSPEALSTHGTDSVLVSGKIAGDVANAVVAYALTKVAVRPILSVLTQLQLIVLSIRCRLYYPFGSEFRCICPRPSLELSCSLWALHSPVFLGERCRIGFGESSSHTIYQRRYDLSHRYLVIVLSLST